MHHMQEPQRARIKRTLDHMAEHDGNIKYDKYTGEIQYDGVKAPDSDVRELLSILTSKKKRITAPKGWDLFMRSLKDTDAPADIHLGWKWNKSVEKGDWGSLKDDKLRSIYENASSPGSYGGVESVYREAKKNRKLK